MVFRDTYLPFSENFVIKHSEAIQAFDTSIVCRTQSDNVPSHFPKPSFDLSEAAGTVESKKLKFLRNSAQFARLANNFDAVLAHHCQDAWRISKLLRNSGIPLLVMAHGSDVLKSNWSMPSHFGEVALRGNWQRFAQQVDRFIAVSDFVEAGLIKRKVPKHKIERIYIGTSCSAVNSFAERSIDYLFVGRLTIEKGFTYFLDSLRNSRDLINIVIIGGGPLESQLYDYLEKYEGSPTKVSFIGIQSGDAVKDFMKKSKFVVIPSIGNSQGIAEGLPMVAMEAYSTGTPVICTNLGGLREVLDMGGSLRLDLEDKDSIFLCSRGYLFNQSSWEALSVKALESWTRYFDIKENIRQFEQVVREEISRKKNI